MKKIFLIFLFIVSFLNAKSNYELKLYETIIPAIFSDYPINVYIDDDMYLLLKDSTVFNIVQNCDSSVTLLIGKNFGTLSLECRNKPVFSTNYRSFKKNQNSFGAFYWRKGRPQIKFNTDVLRKYDLVLPDSLKRYE